MSTDYIYKIQMRQWNNHWHTVYRFATREEAELMYDNCIKHNKKETGWRYRLMQRDECIAQASS